MYNTVLVQCIQTYQANTGKQDWESFDVSPDTDLVFVNCPCIILSFLTQFCVHIKVSTFVNKNSKFIVQVTNELSYNIIASLVAA